MDEIEIEYENRHRVVSSVLVAVTLSALAVGLIIQISIASRAVGLFGAEADKYLLRLVWLALLMLGIDVVILFWLAIRFFAGRNRRIQGGGSTEYVDAWSEAGQRFQLEEENEEDENEDEPQR